MKLNTLTRTAAWLIALAGAGLASPALAQACPDRNVQYWQAFPPGGESDLSARHQQAVLRWACARQRPQP